jgi:polar amino acid transport system substrate-binding protein
MAGPEPSNESRRPGKLRAWGRESQMIRRFLAAAAIAALGLGFAAEADARSLDDIIASGTIRVGVNPNFPPMSSYGATNQFEGFDIDVGNRIAEALGVTAEFVPTETAQRVPFLVADRIDISLGALTRSSERAKLIDYTVPLHTEAMAVLTTEAVPATKWTDLDTADLTIVNMRGNWSVDFLKEKLPKVNVLLVETNADTVRALAQGRADALVENIDFFLAFTKNYPDVKWKTLDDTIFIAYCAIGVQKGNAGLQNFLNILLYELHSANYINEKWEEWYGAPMTAKVEPHPFF